MKVLLRNRKTGQFYSEPNSWSSNSCVANAFETVESATRFGRTQTLSSMEVVLRYDDPVCDLVLPVKQEA